MAAPTKNTLVEVIVAALATTRLRDIGLNALKGVLLSDARLAILDNAVELQAVWDLLASQPEFDHDVAAAPLCYVKTIEDKLGIEVRLPSVLASFTPAEIRARAANCNVLRADLDRILIGVAPQKKRAPTAPAPSRDTHSSSLSGRHFQLIVAALALLGSVGYLGLFFARNTQQAAVFKGMDASEISADIPLINARRWGNEVHAELADMIWLKQPEAVRRRQLEQALERMASRKLSVLIIEDEQKRPKASVQQIGRTGRPFVRFY